MAAEKQRGGGKGKEERKKHDDRKRKRYPRVMVDVRGDSQAGPGSTRVIHRTPQRS